MHNFCVLNFHISHAIVKIYLHNLQNPRPYPPPCDPWPRPYPSPCDPWPDLDQPGKIIIKFPSPPDPIPEPRPPDAYQLETLIQT